MIKRNLLGIDIYDTNMSTLNTFLNGIIQEKEKKIVFGISTAAYGRLKFRRDLFGIYKKIDILIAEGGGIPLFAKMFGVKIREQIGIVNLTYEILHLADKRGYKVLLFGASRETNLRANSFIERKYPNLKLCNGIDGYFNEDGIEGIIETINNEEPHILLIGITYPIKERFSVKYKERLETNLIIPCGGVFEVMAGNVKRPPVNIKYIPTNWLIRFLQEPFRLFKPIIVTMIYTIFWLLPVLYLKHVLRIERNPSVGKYFNLTGDEWDSTSGKIFE